MSMTQRQLRELWEAKHRRPWDGPGFKGAISFADAHGHGSTGSTTPTGAYQPPAPVGLTPELEAMVAEHKANHFGELICPRCRFGSKDGNSTGVGAHIARRRLRPPRNDGGGPMPRPPWMRSSLSGPPTTSRCSMTMRPFSETATSAARRSWTG